MARITGVDIPDNKRGEISLTYIFGIGKSKAIEILQASNVDRNKKVAEWTEEESGKIRSYISEYLKVEGELKSIIRHDIKRLMDIGSYRGIRSRIGLPNRGQKTKNNARTKKGKKKTVANKKKASK